MQNKNFPEKFKLNNYNELKSIIKLGSVDQFNEFIFYHENNNNGNDFLSKKIDDHPSGFDSGHFYYEFLFSIMKKSIQYKQVNLIQCIYEIMEQRKDYLHIAKQTPAIQYLTKHFSNLCSKNDIGTLGFFIDKLNQITEKGFGLAPMQISKLSLCPNNDMILFLQQNQTIDSNDYINIAFPFLKHEMIGKKNNKTMLEFFDTEKRKVMESLFKIKPTEAHKAKNEIQNYIDNLLENKTAINFNFIENFPNTVNKIIENHWLKSNYVCHKSYQQKTFL